MTAVSTVIRRLVLIFVLTGDCEKTQAAAG
jgi:hypothetical protein